MQITQVYYAKGVTQKSLLRVYRYLLSLQLLETSPQVEPKLSHNFNILAVDVEIFGDTANAFKELFSTLALHLFSCLACSLALLALLKRPFIYFSFLQATTSFSMSTIFAIAAFAITYRTISVGVYYNQYNLSECVLQSVPTSKHAVSLSFIDEAHSENIILYSHWYSNKTM